MLWKGKQFLLNYWKPSCYCQFRGVGQYICGILYFKLNGIDAINKVTKLVVKLSTNVISTCRENVVEVLQSLTTSCWTMDTPLFSGHVGTNDALSYLMLSLQYIMLWVKNRIGGVIVSVLAMGAVNHGFEPRSGQAKDYNIGICCLSAKHASFKRKQRLLGRNRDNMSEWATCLSAHCCFSVLSP
jgi:hypothetical protein